MLRILKSLWSQRQLVRAFVVRDLKSRYVGSTMGFFWSVVVPFIYLFVFMVVFNLFMKSRWTDDAGTSDTAIFMLVGILSWHAFAETLSRATNCLVENANLIQKVVFPSEILPAYLTVSSLVNMLIGLPIVVVGAYLASGKVPTVAYLALPLLVACQGLFTVGLGYLLSALNLFLRDTHHLMGVVILVWMFGTPIFYPPTLVEEAAVPLPGTGQSVEVWRPTELSRRRMTLPGKAAFLVDAGTPPKSRWEVDCDLEGLSDEARAFISPRTGDEGQRTAVIIGPDPPEDLDAYVALGTTLHERVRTDEKRKLSLAFILDLNPMYWLINSYRRVVLFGQWPDPSLLARLAVAALVAFGLGAQFFAKHQRRFPDLL